MQSLIITPGQSIGPLTLGMGQEEILDALVHLRHAWDPEGSHKITVTKDSGENDYYQRYQDGFSFFMVRYQNEHSVEIAVDRDLRSRFPILLWGTDVFHTTAERLVTSIKKHSSCICDSADEQLGYNYEFPDIGLRLWREHCFHPKLLLDSKYMQGLWHMVDELKALLYFDLVAVSKANGSTLLY